MKKVLLSILCAMFLIPTFGAHLKVKVGETGRLDHTPPDYPFYDSKWEVLNSGSYYIRIASQSDNYCYVEGLHKTFGEEFAVMHKWKYTNAFGHVVSKIEYLYVEVYDPNDGSNENPNTNPNTGSNGPTSISLEQIYSLGAGLMYILNLTMTPSTASTTVTYKSSNTQVARVEGYDSYCLVTAVSPGVVTITASTSNGLSASTTFTVIEEPIYPDGTMKKQSAEGVFVTYKVLDNIEKTCEVYCSSEQNAIFSGASGALTIPSNVNGYTVVGISNEAFRGHRGITSVTIPNTIEYMGEYAFFECYNLKTVHISDLKAWCNIKMAGGYSNPLHYSEHLYLNGNEIVDLVIPDGVTTLGQQIFTGCCNIKTLTLPNSVSFIEQSAFMDCSKLTKVVMGEKVRKIGNWAFAYCRNLKEITCLSSYMPTTDTKTDKSAFYDLNVGEITLRVPDASVDDYKNTKPWSSFKEIVGIKVADNYKSDNIFYCLNEEDRTAVVKDCDYKTLSKVEIPRTLECNGKSYTVNIIEDGAFAGCPILSSVIIPNSVKTIGNGAFEGCKKLFSVLIGTGVTEIGDRAFANVSKSAHIFCYPAKPPKLGENVFEGQEFFTYSHPYLYLKNDPETDIEAYKTAKQWEYFNSIHVEKDWTLTDGVLTTTYDGVNWTVFEHMGLYSSLFDYAFKTIIFEPGVRIVPDFICAEGCSQLSAVIFPNSVTAIGRYAFYGCISLTSVTLPLSLETIGEFAFSNTGLNKVEVQSVIPPTAPENVINNYNITLVVPQGTRDAYLAATPWNKFTNIVEKDYSDIHSVGVSEISASVFDLQGRKVRSRGESPEKLPKGLYIVDGRKIVIH